MNTIGRNLPKHVQTNNKNIPRNQNPPANSIIQREDSVDRSHTAHILGDVKHTTIRNTNRTRIRLLVLDARDTCVESWYFDGVGYWADCYCWFDYAVACG